MTLGEKIQQLRKISGISQEQLAEQLGVSRQSVSKWELNDSVPEAGKLLAISELFSISLDELLKGNNDEVEECNEDKDTGVLKQLAGINLAQRLINIGATAVISGLILFVIEFMFLPLFGSLQKAHVNSQGYYQNFMDYTKVQPMPTIFTITGILIFVGLILFIKGYIDKRNLNKKR